MTIDKEQAKLLIASRDPAIGKRSERIAAVSEMLEKLEPGQHVAEIDKIAKQYKVKRRTIYRDIQALKGIK